MSMIKIHVTILLIRENQVPLDYKKHNTHPNKKAQKGLMNIHIVYLKSRDLPST